MAPLSELRKISKAMRKKVKDGKAERAKRVFNKRTRRNEEYQVLRDEGREIDVSEENDYYNIMVDHL
jgi:hypothetical protein